MLDQEDKQFIISAVTQAVSHAVSGSEARLGARIDGLDTELRHQGVMLEALQGVVYTIAEGVSTLNDRMDRVEKDVTEIKENIVDLPEIRSTVKKHSRELAALRR